MTAFATLTFRWTARMTALLCALGLGLPVSALAQVSSPSPTNPHGPLPADIDCGACHTPDGWRPVRPQMDFDHNRATSFRLTGGHTAAACVSCHLRARFDEPKVSNAECTTCHIDVHQGNKSETCTECHNTFDFGDVAGVLVHAQTTFPLTGAHVQITCETCHVDDRGGAFATLDSDCFSCHAQDYNSTQSIDHVDLGFSTTCEDCHNTLAWGASGLFDHASASGGFTLVGAHAAARCESCHTLPSLEPIFPGTRQDDCVGCHQPDYDTEHGGGFPTDCLVCHSVEAWTPATFDHVTTSGGFELLGAHRAAPCESCHVVPGFQPVFTTADQNDCLGCHQSDHDTNHGAGFPTDCVRCHTLDTWVGGAFDHVTASAGFDLVGAHSLAPCAGCHVIPGYTPVFGTNDQNDCLGCHQTDHDAQHGAGFPTDCVRCHTLDTWKRATFDHVTASAGFALVGAHALAPCAGCHVIPGYAPVFGTNDQNDCLGCHQTDHDTQHGAGFPTDCVRCHTLDTWARGTFDHLTASAGFGLVGAHATAPCASCHVIPGYAPRFATTNQNDCVGCHQSDYDTQHGTGFPTDCASCHTLDTWVGGTFDHLTASAGFGLVGAHATAPCASCHVIPGYAPRFATTNQNDCVGCHQTDHDAQHGTGFPTDCARCHTLDTWVGAAFDHTAASAGFRLVGAHATAPCASCHVIPGYAPRFATTNQNDCVGCHQSDYDTQHGTGFPTDCVSCHTIDTWVGAAFDHVTTSGGFGLVGAHATAPCASCHVIPGYAPRFTTTNQNDCVGCHQSEHDAQHGTGFPTDCASCHTIDTWVGGAFDHTTASAGFGLVGAHATAPCASCHVIPGYAPLFTTTDQDDCVGCHQSDHDAQHGAGFPTDCVSCHTIDTWVGGVFDHTAASAGFNLVGAHATAPCASCHVIPGYAPRFTTINQNDCVGCHQTDHDAQHGAGFPTDCVSCHSIDTWVGATFNHTTASGGFQLGGAHATAPCASCHVIPGYAPLFTTTNQNDCVGCHQSDHDAQHGAGFPTDCARCHTLDTWVGGTFDHLTASAGFGLVGAHATAPCASCHVIPGYAPRFTTTNQNDCVGCHQTDHDAQHGTGFPTDCVSCHTLDTWVGGTFDHLTASAGFDLVGAHDVAPCASCHVIPGYAPRFATTNQNDCVGCHQSEHDAQHGTGFPTDCVSCHTLDTWVGGTFDHLTASAGFGLVGAHATAPCATCHVIPGYAPRFATTNQNDCVGCHQSDYDTQHGAGFSTDCVSCHAVDTWVGATFNHTTASGGFQLLGAHDVAPCESCHVIPGYALRFATTNQNDCIGCHQSDYDAQHLGTGFSTDCLTCHTINTWGGATFNHDALYFPIYSGRHAGRWSNDCTMCHEVAGDFSQFTCFNCHKHDQGPMDDAHRGRNGYVYESTACLSCHPRGRT